MLEPFIKPHIRHVCVLLPLVRPHASYALLGLHIEVNLKGLTTCIWSFGCCFACATTMGCAGFGLLFATIIFLTILDYYQIKTKK